METPMLTAEQHGQMTLHILSNNYHRPFIEGKCNRFKIEDEIVKALYAKAIPPISQKDVDIVCELIDDLIKNYGVSHK